MTLTETLSMVPCTDVVLRELGAPFLPLTDEGETVLPRALTDLTAVLSRHSRSAYVEAEFFGGAGIQAAMLYEDGHPLGDVLLSSDAINVALRFLGVVRNGDADEFDEVGLGRYRTTEEWAGDADGS